MWPIRECSDAFSNVDMIDNSVVNVDLASDGET